MESSEVSQVSLSDNLVKSILEHRIVVNKC